MAASPEINASGAIRISIVSNGAPLTDTLQLISVTVSKTVNMIPTATIVLLDGDLPGRDFPASNTDAFKPGAEIEIRAGYDQQETVIFLGVIVKHGLKITGADDAQLVIECRDKAVGMTIGRRNANYIDSKDSDILTKLIGNHPGLAAAVDATATTHKELVQYYCTDWDFMLSRAEVNGLLVIVDDAKVTVQAPQTGAAPVLEVTYGEDLMAFQAEIDARTQLASVVGTSWDLNNQAVVESQAVKPASLNVQGNLDSAELAKVAGATAFRLQTSAPMEKTVLETWANGQQVKAGLAKIRGRMMFQGSAKAKAGSLIELKGVGNRFNGKVFVSAVHHALTCGTWTTEVTFGVSPAWFAERRDLVAPPAAGLLPGVEGLQIGVVKKLHEDPEEQHKVQVAVPVLQAETEGVWARLATFYASDGIGTLFVPEIGDEVVLGYINNDPSHPVILGSLYSSKRKPPYTLTEDNFTKALVTKSELKLAFDDDKKVITLITPGNHQIVISDEDKSMTLQDQNDNKVVLSPDGILLDSPKDIAITAQGKVTLDAGGAIEVSAKSDVKIDGSNINHKASVGFVAEGSSAKLSASGTTTVKGAWVMIN